MTLTQDALNAGPFWVNCAPPSASPLAAMRHATYSLLADPHRALLHHVPRATAADLHFTLATEAQQAGLRHAVTGGLEPLLNGTNTTGWSPTGGGNLTSVTASCVLTNVGNFVWTLVLIVGSVQARDGRF